MIPGTGPGRGVPWWRWVRLFRLRHDRVLVEPPIARPGRVIAVIGSRR